MQRKTPLEERLRDAALGDGGCPKACWLYAGSYFRTLSEMGNGPQYTDFYDQAVSEGRYGLQDSFVAQAAAGALSGSLPPGEADGLLYRLLIMPFADKNISL